MNNNKIKGIGICDALFIVFLVLKLCGVISWSWWWITTPLWGVLIICVILFTIAALIDSGHKKRIHMR